MAGPVRTGVTRIRCKVKEAFAQKNAFEGGEVQIFMFFTIFARFLCCITRKHARRKKDSCEACFLPIHRNVKKGRNVF